VDGNEHGWKSTGNSCKNKYTMSRSQI